jgi:hopanoid biosynthesis associated protein HpnK
MADQEGRDQDPRPSAPSRTRQVIFSADDFGLSAAVNDGIERAHREGVLTQCSLMVAGDAVEDAVRRAHTMPGLRVGLHLVVIEGRAVLPPSDIPGLVGPDGWFPSDQARLGVRYFFLPSIRRQLRAEIAAQFETFASTGLTLNHADAHKHMHLHPTVGRLLIEEGARHGLRAIRIPSEPVGVMAQCGVPPTIGARALQQGTRVLRAQARRAGLSVNDHVFGVAWSGAVTEARLLALAPHLPPGQTEIYTHPAAGRDNLLDRLMPTYQHEQELAALLSPALRQAYSEFLPK